MYLNLKLVKRVRERLKSKFRMGKIIKAASLKKLCADFKQQGKKIILAGGCFDILHIGHITFLEAAKKTGEVLILLLESDAAIRLLKGKKRPINNQKNRAKILSAVEFVDFVVLLPKPFRTADYHKLVLEIKPDIIAVTDGDPNIAEKKSQAKSVGGKVKVVLKKIPEHSTTKLLEYF